MIEKKYFKNCSLSWATVFVFYIFWAITPIKSVEQFPEKEDDLVMDPIPWSMRADEILQEHEDKFRYIDSYYQWSFMDNTVVLSLFIVLYAILVLVSGKILSKTKNLEDRIKKSILFFLMLLWNLKVIRYFYGCQDEKGSFFLTDTGLLIINPGYNGKDTWLYYHNIEDIQILTHLTKFPFQYDRRLRIIMKGGKTKEYDIEQMISSHNFQSFYNRLVTLYTDRKAELQSLKEKNLA